MKKILLDDKFFIGLCLIGALVSAWVLMSPSLLLRLAGFEVIQSLEVGEAVYTQYNVEKRTINQHLWLPMYKGDKVHAGDWIMTGGQSKATLKLQKQQQIELAEDTLVYLGKDELFDLLDVKYGSIIADLKPKQELRLRSGKKIIHLQAGDSQSKVKLYKDKNTTQVLPLKGDFKTASTEKKKQEQKVPLTESVEKFQFVRPTYDARFWRQPKDGVIFELTKTPPKGTRLEIYDRDQETKVIAGHVRTKTFRIRLKEEGLYSARLVSPDHKVFDKTDFDLYWDFPPQPLFPLQSDLIPEDSSTIDFSWSTRAPRARYRLQASSEVDFKNLLVDRVTEKTYTTWPTNQRLKQFYWRVKVESSDPAKRPWSEPIAIGFKEKSAPLAEASPAPPTPSTPSTPTPPPQAQSVPTPPTQARSAQAPVASSKQLLKKPEARLSEQEDPEPPPKEEVEVTKQEEKPPTPPQEKLEVAKPEKKPPTPPRFKKSVYAKSISSRNPASLNSARFSVDLSWDKVPEAKEYQIQVFADQTETDLLHSEIVQNTSHTLSLKDIEQDKLHLRVRAKVKKWISSGRSVAKIDLQKELKLEPPTLQQPVSHSEIYVMGEGKDQKIIFSWQGARAAEEFELEIAKDSNFTESVYQKKYNKQNAILPGFPANQDYYWRVRGLHPRGVSDWSKPFTFKIKGKN